MTSTIDETIDQLNYFSVIDVKTYNDQEFAEAYGSGLYDLNHSGETWDTDITPDEMMKEKDNITAFDGSFENFGLISLNRFQRTIKEMKGLISIKMGMK